MNFVSFKHHGFSLYELMTALAVFGILTVVGIPSYISFVRNGEMSSIATNLYADLLYARSEAVKRKTSIVICRSADPAASPPSCGGGAARNWSSGWIVFADSTAGVVGQYDNGTDQLLRVTAPVSTTIQIMSNNTADNNVTYSNSGALETFSESSMFAICDDRDQNGSYDAAYGRQLEISAMGRPKIKSGSGSVTDCNNPV